jgi:hypothetical protein
MTGQLFFSYDNYKLNDLCGVHSQVQKWQFSFSSRMITISSMCGVHSQAVTCQFIFLYAELQINL